MQVKWWRDERWIKMLSFTWECLNYLTLCHLYTAFLLVNATRGVACSTAGLRCRCVCVCVCTSSVWVYFKCVCVCVCMYGCCPLRNIILYHPWSASWHSAVVLTVHKHKYPPPLPTNTHTHTSRLMWLVRCTVEQDGLSSRQKLLLSFPCSILQWESTCMCLWVPLCFFIPSIMI